MEALQSENDILKRKIKDQEIGWQVERTALQTKIIELKLKRQEQTRVIARLRKELQATKDSTKGREVQVSTLVSELSTRAETLKEFKPTLSPPSLDRSKTCSPESRSKVESSVFVR